MKIVSIADTHTKQNKLIIPKADVFCFAGDMSFFNGSKKHYINFNSWLGDIPCKYKICIAGNHDEFFEKRPEEARSLMTNCIYLQDEEVVIDGVKFYGSPWTPVFFNWGFNLLRGRALAEKWVKIPNDIDVLITHGPPYQICDDVGGENVGCEELRKRVFEVQPKVHLFGHVHESKGKWEHIGNTLFINVSMRDKDPYVINLEKDENNYHSVA